MNMLTNLAEMAGISSSYIDKTGKTHNTSNDVRKFFLESMGIKTLTKEDIDEGSFLNQNLLKMYCLFTRMKKLY